MSVGRYARETSVSVEKTRAQVEKLLRDYGATGFAAAWDDEGRRHVLEFVVPSSIQHGARRQVRLVIPYPDPDDDDIRLTPTRKPRSPAQRTKMLEQADRQRWRQVRLLIQAKLEAVEIGISTLEREFLADVVVPELGLTVSEQLEPQLREGKLLQLPPAS